MSAPPGGSRRRLDEDRRRAQIITAAVEVLDEVGYGAATLTRIADCAAVSKGLIWHYFTGKDDLMTAVAESTLTTLTDGIADGLDRTAPVPDVLRSALRGAADLSRTHRKELNALNRIVHNLHGPDGTPKMTLAFYETTYQAQENLFRRGQVEGSLRDFDTRVMAVTYQGAVDMMLGYLNEHPETEPRAYADALADLLLNGIERS